MPIILRGKRAWLNIAYTAQAGPNAGKALRWRGPATAYFAARAGDPAFRKRCGLPDGKTALTLNEMRRFVLPIAEQDWRAWCLGTGGDPRVPPSAPVVTARAIDLIEQWWVRGNRDALKSAHDLRKKRRQVERWLGDRRAEELLKIEMYDALRADALKRGAKSGADTLIAHILRPVTLWALDLDLLSGKSPFSRNKVRVAQSAKRRRVISNDEEARIRLALAADPSRDAGRLLNFMTAMTSLGTRPVECALIQVGDIDFKRNFVILPPEKQKLLPGKAATAEDRYLPYDPSGELATIFSEVRLRGLHHYVFAAGRQQPEQPPEDLTRFGRAILERFRTPWVRGVVTAWDGAAKGSAASQVYKSANVVIRDLRRTTATRWDACGLPRSRVSYLLGHAGGMTGRYVIDDLEALRRDLQKCVWSHGEQQEDAAAG